MTRILCGLVVAVALLAAVGTAVAAPPNDSFTGVWIQDDGDGSNSYWIFSAAGADGTRHFTLFDTYATFCEVDGQPGTGSQLTARGTAVDDGTTISITVTSLNCANGAAGAAPPPIYISARYVNGLLDFGGGFFAMRPGRG